jgi:SAM-dependent methyltransferase
MPRTRTILTLLGAGAAAVAAARRRRHTHSHGNGHAAPHTTEGGTLVGGAPLYDTLTGLALGRFFDGIAANVAATSPQDAEVLEVGCGPGHLALRLAVDHHLAVSGVDLDPAMVDRAIANAERRDIAGDPAPDFQVADVASLPFADASFDVVVSTLSLHHWADPAAGLAEISRVLRPEGRALIWDLRPGSRIPMGPGHGDIPDPAADLDDLPLRLERAHAWRWPFRLAVTQRTELVRTPS